MVFYRHVTNVIRKNSVSQCIRNINNSGFSTGNTPGSRVNKT